jgi:hypothetical protein
VCSSDISFYRYESVLSFSSFYIRIGMKRIDETVYYILHALAEGLTGTVVLLSRNVLSMTC